MKLGAGGRGGGFVVCITLYSLIESKHKIILDPSPKMGTH